jgi:adhesin transport system outer membrane protein
MISNRALLYAITGIIALTMPGAAHAETLRDAVQNALASHPSIDVVKARTEGARESEKEQVSNLFPEINASVAGGRIFSNSSTTRGLTVSRGEAYSWMGEGSASLTQPLFNGFETYRRIDAAEARVQAAEMNITDTKQSVALQAGVAYLNILRAQEALNKTRSYQDRIADYLDRIKLMVDSGAADEAEAAQARNIQAMLENTVAEMEGQVKLAYADYVESVGSMPRGELKKAGIEKSDIMKTADEAMGYAVAYHPLILSAQKEIQAEEKEISAERGVLMPDLDGELSYLKRDQKEEIGGELVDGRAMMRMSWGFQTGGGQIARIRKSKAERSEAIAREAQTKRQIERDIRRAYAEYETALKQKELTASRVHITKDLFETYEKQFEASRVRLLHLMQAENQLFTTELESINADYRVMMAEMTTLASSGRLLSALRIEEAPVPVEQVAPQDRTAIVIKQEAKPVPEITEEIQPATKLEESVGSSPAGK